MFLAKRWCNHGQHEMPADRFRVLPGGKYPRHVCDLCYEKIMEARNAKKKEGFTA